jgi:hypothetical protein
MLAPQYAVVASDNVTFEQAARYESAWLQILRRSRRSASRRGNRY